MAPVLRELERHAGWFDYRVVVTGQHQEQLYQVLNHFGISPHHDLAIMRERQSLAYITSAALEGLDRVIGAERPDAILVHGDTTTTLAGALIAHYHKIPCGHVEAGLRSYNMYSPWPEELNRRLTDPVCQWLFAPTPRSRDNLLREGMDPGRITVTGQTAVDALLLTVSDRSHRFHLDVLNHLDYGSHRLITVTAHRRENQGEPMRRMFTALRRIADAFPDTLMVYPVHLSPAVRKAAWPLLGDHPRILLVEPLSYPDMAHLMARSYLILTDSGGLQEEAPSLGVPLLLMRDTTERPEGVEAGAIKMVGTDEETIFGTAARLLSDPTAHSEMRGVPNPFGDGQAARRIVQVLAHHFGFAATLPDQFGLSGQARQG